MTWTWHYYMNMIDFSITPVDTRESCANKFIESLRNRCARLCCSYSHILHTTRRTKTNQISSQPCNLLYYSDSDHAAAVVAPGTMNSVCACVRHDDVREFHARQRAHAQTHARTHILAQRTRAPRRKGANCSRKALANNYK